MSSENDIARFLPEYPPPEKAGVNLFSKKEFHDLKLGPSEPIPDEPGQPLLSQELQGRFFSPHSNYKNVLLFHGMGTGKTCTTSLIVENFKNTKVGGNKRQKAIVLVPNDDLAKSYKSQVEKQCTDHIYNLTEGQDENKKIVNPVKNTYSIQTYNNFIKKIPPSTQVVKQRYSNRIIIIDEVHHFKIQTDKKKEALAKYKKIHNFLHTVENCRIMLLSGTPIWDRPDELASVMNLILPLDEQLPTKSAFNKRFFKNGEIQGIQELKSAFRGRVSFLRPMITSAKRNEYGLVKPWMKYIKVYPSAMSEFQSKHAQKAMEEKEKEIRRLRKKDGTTVLREVSVVGGIMGLQARHAATFVFPIIDKDGNVIGADTTKNSFKKVLDPKVFKRQEQKFNIHKKTTTSRVYRYKDRALSLEIRKNLPKYSSKFAAIVKWITDNPKELCFIFGKFVNSPSGVLNLGIILQIMGFKWVKSLNSIKTPGEKRFAIISSQEGTINNSEEIKKFVEEINKPRNMYGDYCQILIGTTKIAEGISLKNFRQIHNYSPHWNNSLTEQALARGFRVGSHNDLPLDERYIRIFRHCAVNPGQLMKNHTIQQGYTSVPDSGFGAGETMDTRIYGMAETKEHFNTQLYRIMKESAWDCPLTYGRNVLETDEDGSRACDYQKCNYTCDGFSDRSIDKTGTVWNYNPGLIDRTGYELYYSKDTVKDLIDKVIVLFGNYFNLDFDSICQLIPIDKGDEHLLLVALDSIISLRISIKNMYGFGSMLKESGNVYFLDQNPNIHQNFSENVYSSNPLVTDKTPTDELIDIYKFLEDSNRMEKLCGENREAKCSDLQSIMKNLNHKSFIIFVENLYQKKVHSECEKLLIDEILENDYIVKMENGAIVHTMYASEYTGIGYNVVNPEMNPEGLTRIFIQPDSGNGVWQYVTDIDQEKKIIQNIKNRKKVVKGEDWGDYDILGFRDKTGKFKIKLKTKSGENPKKGSVCAEGWSKQALIELYHKYGIFPIPLPSLKDKGKQELIYQIKAQPELGVYLPDLEKLNSKQLRSIITLGSYNKVNLCNGLESWMKEKDIFYNR